MRTKSRNTVFCAGCKQTDVVLYPCIACGECFCVKESCSRLVVTSPLRVIKALVSDGKDIGAADHICCNDWEDKFLGKLPEYRPVSRFTVIPLTPKTSPPSVNRRSKRTRHRSN